MAVLNLMSSSPIAMFVRQCSVQQKVMMAAVVRCVRREGVPEIPWRSVSRRYFAFGPFTLLLASHTPIRFARDISVHSIR